VSSRLLLLQMLGCRTPLLTSLYELALTPLLLLLLPLQVYYPELQAAAADAGVQHPQEAWEQFGRDILARQPEETQQQNTGLIRAHTGFEA
jgi:hypothetical protein